MFATPPPPAFHAHVETIRPALRARMTSWRRGCPVPLRDLRLLRMTHWGFDPMILGGHVEPPSGARFRNRSSRAPGVIHAGGVVVRAFAAVGWSWGGRWTSPRDYQHFSATGS